MNDLLWVAGILFLIVPGLALWRLPAVGRLDLPARLAVAFAGGVVITSTLLYLYSLAHLPWTRTALVPPLLLIACVGAGALAGPARADARRYTWIVIATFVVLTIYGIVTARETCGDLIYFWGPKGLKFHYAGKIDADFLGFPHYYLMHSDYPPLLPLTYAWASLVAHRFSWWGALWVTPIALAATAAAFRGLAREWIREERANWYAVLLTAILGYGFAIGMVGGAAEPLLLLFEVIAISALTFAGGERDAQILASIALAGTLLIKVEGAAFVALAVIAYAITSRRFARAAVVAMPAAILLTSWLLFAWRHHLLDSYTLAKGRIHFELIGTTVGSVLRQASYKVAYLPWIATVAPLAIGRRFQRTLLPLLVAAGSLASVLFFYLHAESPTWWIEASAQRVLLTPLVCLVVASAASSE